MNDIVPHAALEINNYCTYTYVRTLDLFIAETRNIKNFLQK